MYSTINNIFNAHDEVNFLCEHTPSNISPVYLDKYLRPSKEENIRKAIIISTLVSRIRLSKFISTIIVILCIALVRVTRSFYMSYNQVMTHLHHDHIILINLIFGILTCSVYLFNPGWVEWMKRKSLGYESEKVGFRYGYFLYAFCSLANISYLVYAFFAYQRIGLGFQDELLDMFELDNIPTNESKANDIQIAFSCCGVIDYNDWAHSSKHGRFNPIVNSSRQTKIPNSCCVELRGNSTCEQEAELLKGCNDALTSNMNNQLKHQLIMLLIILFLFNVFSFILTLKVEHLHEEKVVLVRKFEVFSLYEKNLPTSPPTPIFPPEIIEHSLSYSNLIEERFNQLKVNNRLNESHRRRNEDKLERWKQCLSLEGLKTKFKKAKQWKLNKEKDVAWKLIPSDQREIISLQVKLEHEIKLMNLRKLMKHSKRHPKLQSLFFSILSRTVAPLPDTDINIDDNTNGITACKWLGTCDHIYYKRIKDKSKPSNYDIYVD